MSKLEMVAVSRREIQWIARYLMTSKTKPNGICHGVRNGFEVGLFRQITGGDVIGTEISETANQFQGVIQWDFHNIKNEWIGKFDFVYSNSWDHSFDPNLMLNNWMKSLNPGGKCFLQWTHTHGEDAVGGADCFGLSFNELINWIRKDYKVEKIHWLYEFSLFDLRRYAINLYRRPRPGIRGRKIAIVVVVNR